MTTITRPILGVIACGRQVGEEPAQAVMLRYLDAAMAHADAAALIVPSLPGLMRAEEVAGRLDGLLLTGSPSNVAPLRYGDTSAGDGPFDLGRDEMTARLTDTLLELGRPVFGICRGFQELNVLFGGTLHRNVSGRPGALAHHAPDDVTVEQMFAHTHPVSLTCGGLLNRLHGTDRLDVNSVHYQGVDQIGGSLQIEAVALDGTPEAFSAEVNGAPVVAVQWHPEWRTSESKHAPAFFAMLGRALRGQPLLCESTTHVS